MKVIKVVEARGGKLVSTFAPGEWQKEYAKGVEVKPDIGYLFAYSRRSTKQARKDMGGTSSFQFWLAEAKVVGKVADENIGIWEGEWSCFWSSLKLRLRLRGADYLLCSSITLIKELKI